jgi:SAM-dependent methyltransferase
MSVSPRIYRFFYPDDRLSGTIFFYDRLRRDLESASYVLNLGAGPGDPRDSVAFAIRDVRGPGRTVDGCDPDTAVLDNAQLDRARIMERGRIPYDDDFFDVAFSDYVLEHVEDPLAFMAEAHRVLKPGGAFHFRTPNALHYVSIAARVLPYRAHSLTANRARGLAADAHLPYPTFHRLNTGRAIKRAAAKAGFRSVELTMIEAEPNYLVFNTLAFLGGVAYERAVNRFAVLRSLRANIVGRAVK